MKELEKYITDERTGLKYELVGDYYFLAGDDDAFAYDPKAKERLEKMLEQEVKASKKK